MRLYICIYIYIYIYSSSSSSKLATIVKGEQKAPFSIGEGATPFLGLHHFTLDTYLILLNVKQGGIKYHF